MPHAFVVQLDIPTEHEAEFNRVYDTEHFPMLSKVPGVRSAARYRLEHSTVPGMQRHAALPDDLRARFTRGDEDRGVGESGGLWRLGDKNSPEADRPPS